MSPPRVGYIGLGDIGAPMAWRIHAAGHALSVYNRSPARSAPFAAQGIDVAATAAQLATDCDLVFTCVSDTAAMEQLVFGAKGIAEGARPGTLLVDCSTIHPVRTRELAARLLRERGMAWVDAPVSGGPAGARAGTLAVFAGGKAEDVERARPVLQAFAGQVTLMGPVGNGMAAKVCNQMLSFGSAAVIAETLTLAANFGIDPRLMPKAVTGGFADSNVLRHYGQAMIDGSYAGKSRTGLKDLDIALDIARETGSATPMTSLVASFFRLVIAQGHTNGGLATPMRLYSEGPLAARPQQDPQDAWKETT